jgi:transmembrane sensor
MTIVIKAHYMETYNRLAVLILKWLKEELKQDESNELDAVIQGSEKKRLLFEQVTDINWIGREMDAVYQYDKNAGWEKLMELQAAEGITYLKPRFLWGRLMVAATFLAAISVWAWFLLNKDKHQPVTATTTVQKTPVTKQRNGNNSLLILANNDTLELDSKASTSIPAQGNTTIIWRGNDTLVYDIHKKNFYNHSENARTSHVTVQDSETSYNNTVIASKRKALWLQMPDGTIVKLDTAAAIQYKADTSGKERIMEMINGGVQFNVAHNPQKPFRVQFNDIVITALGTKFKVYAFPGNRSIQARLQEGSIEIRNPDDKKILATPGYEALAANAGAISIKKPVTVIKPKTEDLSFNNDDFRTTVKKLEAWYGVRVEYIQIPQGGFSAVIDRTIGLSDIIPSIESAFNIKMKVEGKKIIVLP